MIAQFEARVFIFGTQVIIPTIRKTEAGLYLLGEPVAVVPLRDREEIIAVLAASLALGNPTVPTPPDLRRMSPKSIAYYYSGARSNRHFMSEAKNWRIAKIDRCYFVQPLRPEKSSWSHDQDCIEIPEHGDVVQIATQIVELILQKEQQARQVS